MTQISDKVFNVTLVPVIRRVNRYCNRASCFHQSDYTCSSMYDVRCHTQLTNTISPAGMLPSDVLAANSAL